MFLIANGECFSCKHPNFSHHLSEAHQKHQFNFLTQKMTQKQLADKAGVGLNFVYQLEKEKSTVQLDCTQQVLDALGFEFSIVKTSQQRMAVQNHPKPQLPWD